MAAGEEKLKLVLEAIDRTAAPLRAVNKRIEGMLAPVRKVRNAMRSLANEAGLPAVGQRLATLGKQFTRFAAIGVGALAGVLEFTRRTAEWADGLSEMTRQLGIGVEQFQEYQFAAHRAGVDSEAFAGSMRFLTKNVGQLKAGTGPLLGLLKRVSPALASQVKGAKDTGEAFEIMLGGLRKLKDPMQRNTLAAAAFGRSGQAMALMAGQSAEEFEALRAEARRLGMVLSQEDAAAAEETMDVLDDLKGSALGLARGIATSLFPAIQTTGRELLAFIAANRDLIVSNGRAAVLKLADAVFTLGKFLASEGPKVLALVETLGGLRTVLIAIAAISLAPLVASLVTVGAALGPIGLGISAAAAAVAFLMVKLERLSGLKQRILDVIDPFATAAPAIANAGVTSQAAAAAGGRFDLAGQIDIRLDQRGARVTGAQSSLPGVGFGILPRGPALAPN